MTIRKTKILYYQLIATNRNGVKKPNKHCIIIDMPIINPPSFL